MKPQSGAEVEPWIAANPADKRNMVTAWQQDRWADGGARGLAVGVTHDGGRSWREVVIPGLTVCAGGTHRRASDPWVSFASNGDLYAAGLGVGDDGPGSVHVSKSTDGGDHWDSPVEVQGKHAGSPDKESITADPTNPRYVYTVWDEGTENSPPSTVLARSTDGGRTWESASTIYDPTEASGTPSQTIGNQIGVLPDGTLVDVFAEINFPRGTAYSESLYDFDSGAGTPPPSVSIRERAIRSTDHGKTWSAPVTISPVNDSNVVDPDNLSRNLRAPGLLPDVGVDARTGKLYVTWADGGLSTSGSAIALSSSSDGGLTWSPPKRVNKTPDSAAGGNGQAFTPSVDVASDGTVAVTYYDFRHNTAAPGALTDYWMITCRKGRGCENAATWREQHLGGSFDIEKAADAGGYFLGDYMGLTHIGHHFVSVFTMTTGKPDNPQDEYVVTTR